MSTSDVRKPPGFGAVSANAWRRLVFPTPGKPVTNNFIFSVIVSARIFSMYSSINPKSPLTADRFTPMFAVLGPCRLHESLAALLTNMVLPEKTLIRNFFLISRIKNLLTKMSLYVDRQLALLHKLFRTEMAVEFLKNLVFILHKSKFGTFMPRCCLSWLSLAPCFRNL